MSASHRAIPVTLRGGLENHQSTVVPTHSPEEGEPVAHKQEYWAVALGVKPSLAAHMQEKG